MVRLKGRVPFYGTCDVTGGLLQGIQKGKMDQEVRGRETCRRRGENTKGRGPWAINDEAADKETGGHIEKLLNMMPSWEVESRKKGPGHVPPACSRRDGPLPEIQVDKGKVDCSVPWAVMDGR